MNYEEALQYIHSTRRFGARLGLHRIEKLLELLGSPQNKLNVIHVAGTNGKGSTCAYIASVLEKAGYSVGLYSSPALLCFNERIQINRNFISNEDIAFYVQKVKASVDRMLQEGLEHPTEFEIVTAMALLYFEGQKTDFVVLEVGLGGRYDATNVITQPILTVLTSIGMDHKDVLGDSLEKIAYEKCGILKNGSPVVVCSQKESIYKIIEEQAKQKNILMYSLQDAEYSVTKRKKDKQIFNFQYKNVKYEEIETTMLGSYQITNASNALLALYALQQQGIGVSMEAIYEGVRSTYWQGRFEVLTESPLFIIDGAHNEDGARVLKETLWHYKETYRIQLLLGILQDKAYEKMLPHFVEVADEILISEVSDNPRALPKEDLYVLVKELHPKVSIFQSLDKQLLPMLACLSKDTLLCCAGSLYFISEVKRLYIKEERLL